MKFPNENIEKFDKDLLKFLNYTDYEKMDAAIDKVRPDYRNMTEHQRSKLKNMDLVNKRHLELFFKKYPTEESYLSNADRDYEDNFARRTSASDSQMRAIYNGNLHHARKYDIIPAENPLHKRFIDLKDRYNEVARRNYFWTDKIDLMPVKQNLQEAGKLLKLHSNLSGEIDDSKEQIGDRKYNDDLGALPISTAKEYTKAWKESGADKLYGEYFKGENRIYLPVNFSGIPIDKNCVGERNVNFLKIQRILNAYDYKTTPVLYVQGICYKIDEKTGKRIETRIGKVLNNIITKKGLEEYQKNEVKQTLKLFETDKCRELSQNKEKLLAVISRHPYDIAGMSTDRGWTSCLNLGQSIDLRNAEFEFQNFANKIAIHAKTGGKEILVGYLDLEGRRNEYPFEPTVRFNHLQQKYYFGDIEKVKSDLINSLKNSITDTTISRGCNAHYVIEDVKHGTLVAYLINENDKNIEHPLGRVLIKRLGRFEFFFNPDKSKIPHYLMVSDETYGTVTNEFLQVVKDWVDEYNKNAPKGTYILPKEVYPEGKTNITLNDLGALPHEHSARLAEPKRYKDFRRQNNRFGQGVDVIWGITPKGKAEVQALRFRQERFSPEDAENWLKKHHFEPIMFEPAGSYMSDNIQMISDSELGSLEFAVYHGSPHSFNKFTTEKIGTGEGANAYGWGLYFTDKKEIAEWYANELTRVHEVKFIDDIKTSEIYDDLFNKYKNIIENLENIKVQEIENRIYDIIDKQRVLIDVKKEINETLTYYKITDKKKLYDKLNSFFELTPEDKNSIYARFILEFALELIDKNAEIKSDNKNIYKVKIHGDKDVNDLNFLDWDKPISEEQRKAIVQQWNIQYPETLFPIGGLPEGKSMYQHIDLGIREYYNHPSYLDSLRLTSLFLLRAGIDGIKYCTGDTRHHGCDAYNYVIFDENAVEIEEHQMYGLEDKSDYTKLNEIGKRYARLMASQEKKSKEWYEISNLSIKIGELATLFYKRNPGDDRFIGWYPHIFKWEETYREKLRKEAIIKAREEENVMPIDNNIINVPGNLEGEDPRVERLRRLLERYVKFRRNIKYFTDYQESIQKQDNIWIYMQKVANLLHFDLRGTYYFYLNLYPSDYRNNDPSKIFINEKLLIPINKDLKNSEISNNSTLKNWTFKNINLRIYNWDKRKYEKKYLKCRTNGNFAIVQSTSNYRELYHIPTNTKILISNKLLIKDFEDMVNILESGNIDWDNDKRTYYKQYNEEIKILRDKIIKKYGSEGLADDVNQKPEAGSDKPEVGSPMPEVDNSTLNTQHSTLGDVIAVPDEKLTVPELKVDENTKPEIESPKPEENNSMQDTRHTALPEKLPELPTTQDILIAQTKGKPLILNRTKALFNELLEPFSMLIYGKAGHGKTSFSLILAQDLEPNGKALYILADKGTIDTRLQKQLERLKIHKNITFYPSKDWADPGVERYLNNDEYKYVFIDKIGDVFNIKPEELKELIDKYPNKSFIYIARTNKAGKEYIGDPEIAFKVDTIVFVENMTAKTIEKHRDGETGKTLAIINNKKVFDWRQNMAKAS